MSSTSPTTRSGFDPSRFVTEELMPTIKSISREQGVALAAIKENLAMTSSLTGEKPVLSAECVEVLNETEDVFLQKYRGSRNIQLLLIIIFASFKGQKLSYEVACETLSSKFSEKSQTPPSPREFKLQDRQAQCLMEINRLKEEGEKLIPEIKQTRAVISRIQTQRGNGRRTGANSTALLTHTKILSRQTSQTDQIKKRIEALETELTTIRRELSILAI